MSTASRKRLACRICTRRKVRCDKKIPCENCVRRGTAVECDSAETEELDSQIGLSVGGRSDENPSLNALKRRVAELEAALKEQNAVSSTSAAGSSASVAEQAVAHVDSLSPSQDSDIEDAVTVLEFLAWGRMKDPEKTMLSPAALRISEPEDAGTGAGEDADSALSPEMDLAPWLQILLPSRQQVYQLVNYHNNCLLWFHGSYLAPTFSKQLDSFYIDHNGNFDSKGLNLQWVALLFSIMAGTITSAPAREARSWGFDANEAKVLSGKWFKAVISSLNAANFTANHSLHAVQAITSLTNTAHMLGHSNTQAVMLASTVRIAQSLGLHRLDQDARGGDTELETGRRVWQELCTQDWFSTAFSESYSINPLHSMSLPPKNCDDNMHELPETEPTITSFCRFLAQIAAIMPALQDSMALSNTLYTKHAAVLVHDKTMRSLATGRPQFLANTAFDANWPCYIPWARQAIAMSSAHKIIVIHRKFLGLSFTNPMFAFTRRTCLAASKTILKEYLVNSKDESSPMLWTHQAFSVAACIVVCFDILHSSSASQDGVRLVEQTMEHLQLCRQKSMIATRGVKVLNALRKQIAARTESRKRSFDDARPETSRKRHKGFDVAEFARLFCDGEDATASANQIQERQSPGPEAASWIQSVPENLEAVAMEESLMLPADLTWIWKTPVNDEAGSRTFDSLLSFANQGLGF